MRRTEISQVPQASIQKPSGPRSKAGKQRSSQNAIKHGILSDVTVLPGEPRETYKSLLTELHEALEPGDKLEEFLVDKLASLSWRYRRLLAAEGAEIRQGSEFVEWDQRNRERLEAASTEARAAKDIVAPDAEEFVASEPGLIHKVHIPQVLDYCLELLGQLRRDIEANAFDPTRDTEVLEKVYGTQPEFGRTLAHAYEMCLATSSDQGDDYTSLKQGLKKILSAIDEEIHRLREYGRQRASIESDRTKLEVLRHGIPEPARLDRLLRYEATLERNFDRTLSQFERMQRLRRGQPVAPRIDVTIAKGG